MNRRVPRLSALVVVSAALTAVAVARRLAAARRRDLEPAGHAGVPTQPTRARQPVVGRPHGEELYRRLVDGIDHAVFELDQHGRCTFLNHAWRELTGHEVEAALGRPLVSAIHPDDRHHLQELSSRVFAGRDDACRCEVRVVTATGATRWAEVRLRPIVGDAGVTGLTGTMSDVTPRRAVQQELERARQVAEQASTARSEFLRAMSHEMRTPLNGTLGMMELLASTPLDGQQARYVAAARASASHLGALVNDIIELSRMDMGSLQPDRSVFDLPDLIESTVGTVARDASSKHLRLSCTVATDVPTWVSGDAGRLRQVLVNLLVNAVKFTEAGGVHVQADAEVDRTTRQATLRLVVEDTGPGIPAERGDRLFTPFTPGDPTSPRRQSGTGLGLTVCKRLVEVLQGTIAVGSGRDGAASVSVTVPLEVADVALVESHRCEEARALVKAPEQAAAGATVPADTATGDWAAAPRVLVADDHDINRMVVHELLTAMGCHVEVVPDGATAFERAVTRSFDAIIMDCQMPELDGVEATRRLRRAQAEGRVARVPKIIALTAHATAEDRQACLDAGMDAYLTKPLRGTVLQRTLQRLLAGETRRAPQPELSVPAAPAPSEPVPDAEDILDPAEVLLRCDRNADLGARMLQLFAESLPDELARLDAAAAANDTVALGAVTHKMRGAAATLAAVRLAGALTAVELFLKYGDGGPLVDLLADVRHESALFLGVVPQTCRRLAEATAVPPGG